MNSIGERIRTIRQARGMSQKELAEKVGLISEQITKYENGVRKPKEDRLNTIAEALDVSVYCISDPSLENESAVMHIIFDLGTKYGLKPVKHDDDTYLSFDNPLLSEYITQWYYKYHGLQIAISDGNISDEQKADLYRNYEEYQWDFPNGNIKTDIRKAALKNQIELLQAELQTLEDSE